MISTGPLAAAACAALLGRAAKAETQLSRAPSSAVHRITLDDGLRVIVKLHFGPARGKAEQQCRALQSVRTHTDLFVPAVLACDDVPPAAVLIMQDVGEADLGRATEAGWCTRAQALHALGDLLGRLHRLPADLGPDPPHARAPHDASRLISLCPPMLAAAAANALARAGEVLRDGDPVWCHGDLHPANVLATRTPVDRLGALYLVDFEEMVYTRREYDLAQCLVTSDALDQADRVRIEAGYGLSLDRDAIDALLVFHAVRGWVYAAHAEQRDRQLWAVRLRKTLDTFRDLQRTKGL